MRALLISVPLAVVVSAGVMVAVNHPIPGVVAVDPCRLQAKAGEFNRKEIEVAALVRHDFEGFTLADSSCAGAGETWLEYGGTRNSDVIYCCGVTAGGARQKPIVVQGISVPLVEDEMFRRFDDYISNGGRSSLVQVRATVRGRFFAGSRQSLAGGKEWWGGYGHLGCCSLLVIEQVLDVDRQTPAISMRPGAVGPVAIGSSRQDLAEMFPPERRRAIALMLEGEASPGLALTLARSSVADGIVAELETGNGRDEVSRIWVRDPLARTEKGIGVGSTVAELRAAYKGDWVGWGEGRLYMRVEELGASFELDQSKHPQRVLNARDPGAIPGDVKIVGVLLTSTRREVP